MPDVAVQPDDPWAAFPLAQPAAPQTVGAPADAGADPWAAFPLAKPATDSAIPPDFKGLVVPLGTVPARPPAPPAPPVSGGRDFADIAADLGTSAVSGIVSGVEGLAALPSTAMHLGGLGMDLLTKKLTGASDEDIARSKAEAAQTLPGKILNVPGRLADDVAYAAKTAIDVPTFGIADYQPKTTAGKFVKTTGEFVPGALTGGGSVAARMLKFAVAPGIASEGVGQVTKGKAVEPYARAAAAILAGGGAAFLGRAGLNGQRLAKAFENIPPADAARYVDEAEALIQHAASQPSPITLTWPEALARASGGRVKLTDTQRIVEGSGRLQDVMGGRREQVRAATQDQLSRIEPQVAADPHIIGREAGQAAEQTIGATTANINAQARPLYRAAEPVRVGQRVSTSFGPIYDETLREIRNNPALNERIAHLPDDSVGVIDLVQRRMRERAEAARIPGQASSSNLAAMNFEQSRTAPLAAADTATGSRAATATTPAAVGTYEGARSLEAELRAEYLEPLMAGPMGKMAGRDTATQSAIDALFPAAPIANSEQQVGDAIRALHARGQRGAWAARQLVRSYVEGVFGAAKPELSGEAGTFGGARFRNLLQANPQVASNLQAALEALPNGATIAPGFERFMEVLAATGERQRIGTTTSFNTEYLNELKQGGIVGSVVRHGSTGGLKLPHAAFEKFKLWSMGRNLDQLADLLVNPEAGEQFRRLATLPTGSAKALAIVTRLGTLAGEGIRHRDRPSQPPFFVPGRAQPAP